MTEKQRQLLNTFYQNHASWTLMDIVYTVRVSYQQARLEMERQIAHGRIVKQKVGMYCHYSLASNDSDEEHRP